MSRSAVAARYRGVWCLDCDKKFRTVSAFVAHLPGCGQEQPELTAAEAIDAAAGGGRA